METKKATGLQRYNVRNGTIESRGDAVVYSEKCYFFLSCRINLKPVVKRISYFVIAGTVCRFEIPPKPNYRGSHILMNGANAPR
jgi:hypothetical protein